jgi:hypothetical protein
MDALYLVYIHISIEKKNFRVRYLLLAISIEQTYYIQWTAQTTEKKHPTFNKSLLTSIHLIIQSTLIYKKTLKTQLLFFFSNSLLFIFQVLKYTRSRFFVSSFSLFISHVFPVKFRLIFAAIVIRS